MADHLKKLIEKAKSTSTIKTTQKVVPIKKKVEDEVQCSFYLNKRLMKKIKLFGLNENMTFKSIMHDALEKYLE